MGIDVFESGSLFGIVNKGKKSCRTSSIKQTWKLRTFNNIIISYSVNNTQVLQDDGPFVVKCGPHHSGNRGHKEIPRHAHTLGIIKTTWLI